MKCKQTESHFDDIKYAGMTVLDFEREITEQEWKNHLIVKYSTRSLRVYIYIYKHIYIRFWISFPYKLYTCTKVSCWNRRVFKPVTGSSAETQVSAAAGGTANT